MVQFCQRFGCVYDYETYAVFDKFDKYKKHDFQLSRVTIIHVYTNPMTMQKIVKAISRNKTWGSEIVQSSEDNVKFSNRNSDNLLLRKLDILKLACNQKSDEFTTLTVNEIVQENTPDIQPPQKKKPRLIECLGKFTRYSTSENINNKGHQWEIPKVFQKITTTKKLTKCFRNLKIGEIVRVRVRVGRESG